MRNTKTMLVILLLALILTGGLSTTLAQDPVQGGRLVYGQTTDIFRFDPYDLAIGNFAMLNTVYDPLVRVSVGSEPQPWLAESWEFNEDGTALTLNLVEGVLFHSGREMTAEDVQWTIEAYQDPANAAIVQQATTRIVGMEVVDDYTITLEFDDVYPTIFDLLELIFVVVQDGAENIRNTPAGTGPFQLAEWQQGLEARYVRNENYWQEGQPYLDEFVQRVFPDPQAMVAALEAGAIDIAMYPSVQDFERLEDSDSVVSYTAFGCCETNVNFNTANAPWDNVLVRQAMNHAIDRQRLVDIAFQGNSYPICQPIRSGWAHNPDISVDDECAYDLELAASLLEEAGYGDGFAMQALVSSSVMPESSVLAQIMREDLATLGIEVEILDLEQTAYNNMGDTSQYQDMYIQVVGRTNKDPGSLYSLTVAFRPETNVAQYRDEEYEGLVFEGLRTVDLEERAEIYNRIAEIVVEQNFSLVVAPRPELYLMTPSIQGFALSRDGMLYSDQVWMSE
jgi:peptide/nickel transport system substrate-binding protein